MADSKVKITNRKDILLLLLYVQGKTKELGEAVSGRTRLMKMLYLFGKELYHKGNFDRYVTKDKLSNFEAYKYGPFSIDVFRDINFFINIGYIEAKNLEGKDASVADIEEFSKYLDEFIFEGESAGEEITAYEEEEFRLTEQGKQFASTLYKQLTEAQKKALVDFKGRYNSSNLTTLLRYVYKTYPDSVANVQ